MRTYLGVENARCKVQRPLIKCLGWEDSSDKIDGSLYID